MKLIVGSTGLVGKSLIEQENFDFKFHSKIFTDLMKLPWIVMNYY